MNKVFLPAFSAREDTSTQMRVRGFPVAVNIAGSLLMFPGVGHAVIAIATSASGLDHAILLAVALMRRGDFRLDAAPLKRAPLLLEAL